MIERDYQLLLHIRKNCNNIISYQKRFGDSFDDFLNDDAYRDAVSMCIMQIGELANGFSDDFCKEEQFPYKEMRGMRNVLVQFKNMNPIQNILKKSSSKTS